MPYDAADQKSRMSQTDRSWKLFQKFKSRVSHAKDLSSLGHVLSRQLPTNLQQQIFSKIKSYVLSVCNIYENDPKTMARLKLFMEPFAAISTDSTSNILSFLTLQNIMKLSRLSRTFHAAADSSIRRLYQEFPYRITMELSHGYGVLSYSKKKVYSTLSVRDDDIQVDVTMYEGPSDSSHFLNHPKFGFPPETQGFYSVSVFSR